MRSSDDDNAVSNGTLTVEVFTSPTHDIGGTGLTFSPTSSSIVFGEHEAIVVDAQYMAQDVEALGDMIEDLGRTLTTIFITHGHGDHYFGMDQLAGRFPGARVVSTAGVVADIAAHGQEQIAAFSLWFPGSSLVLPSGLPEVLDGELTVDGHRLDVMELRQADIGPSAIVHIPELHTVIAGDLAYDGIHQMLALSGPAEWDQWIASVEAVAELKPEVVVAGHRNPDGGNRSGDQVLTETIAYIRDFQRFAASSATPDDLVAAMLDLYADRGNITTLRVSAQSAFPASASGQAIGDGGPS